MTKLKIHYLQHAPHEGAGYISNYAQINGYSLSSTKLFRNELLPELNTFDVLVIMGGPMGVNEESKFAWLKTEKIIIRSAIEAGKKVIGICLGSQMLASVLNARVYPNKEKEIGFFPLIKKSNNGLLKGFPEKSVVFQWHGDTFDIPVGAELLASSEACVNQAFLFGENVLALQFHLEITEELLKGFLKSGKNELLTEPYVQSAVTIKSGFKFIPSCNLLLKELLNNFLNDA
jgi:GMP synthase-like glutamine amidotransferase